LPLNEVSLIRPLEAALLSFLSNAVCWRRPIHWCDFLVGRYILSLRKRDLGNLLFFRTFLKEGDPKPGVDRVKDTLRVYPLSQASNLPAVKFVDISGKAFNTISPGDYSLFEFVNRVIQDEPIDALDPDTLASSPPSDREGQALRT
jgi:hypothetical protein